jgi:hypothetical protein
MSTISLKLYDFAKHDLKLSDAKAKEFVEVLREEILEDIKARTNDYKSLWKGDFNTLYKRILDSKLDMYKAMFITGIVQLVAILGGVLAIVKFMMGK